MPGSKSLRHLRDPTREEDRPIDRKKFKQELALTILALREENMAQVKEYRTTHQ